VVGQAQLIYCIIS